MHRRDEKTPGRVGARRMKKVKAPAQHEGGGSRIGCRTEMTQSEGEAETRGKEKSPP